MRLFFSIFLFFNIIINTGIAQESSIKAFKAKQSPVLDGKINEPAWDNATPFSDFKMVEPIPGSQPTEKTEVRILYDQANLYIAVRCYDSEPDKITAIQWNMIKQKRKLKTR